MLAVYSKLLNTCLPNSLLQGNVIPISYDLVVKSVKRLKSKSIDIDGICAQNVRPDSKELMLHL